MEAFCLTGMRFGSELVDKGGRSGYDQASELDRGGFCAGGSCGPGRQEGEFDPVGGRTARGGVPRHGLHRWLESMG